MAGLFGEYECKLDEKGRIILPALLKKQVSPDAQDRFMINRGFESYLALYPLNEWDIIKRNISRLNLYIKKNRDFVRYFFRGATEISLDGSNRILLPKSLLEYAKIEKEVTLLGFIDHIEIWSKATYTEWMSNEPKDYGQLAEEVMGKQDKPEYPNGVS
jgi:MraZ protein